MANPNSANQGEGNPEAAARFNSAETAFVESARGKEQIRKGAKVLPAEERSLAEAEQRGKARSMDSRSKPEVGAER